MLVLQNSNKSFRKFLVNFWTKISSHNWYDKLCLLNYLLNKNTFISRVIGKSYPHESPSRTVFVKENTSILVASLPVCLQENGGVSNSDFQAKLKRGRTLKAKGIHVFSFSFIDFHNGYKTIPMSLRLEPRRIKGCNFESTSRNSSSTMNAWKII